MSNMVPVNEPPSLPPKDKGEQRSDSWYYASKDSQLGPVSAEVIGELVRGGLISADTFVWNPDFGPEWRTVREIAFALQSTQAEPALILTATARYVLSRLRFEKHHVDYRAGSVLIRIDDEEHVFKDSNAIEQFGREKGYLPPPPKAK